MANYATLKAAVQSVVKSNGNKEITGPNMQSTLISIINELGAGYQFMGVATPSTSPGTPDYNVAYIGGAGTYNNFGSSTLTVPVGAVGVFRYNGSWSFTTIRLFEGIDNQPTMNSNNLLKSGGMYKTLSSYALLNNIFNSDNFVDNYYIQPNGTIAASALYALYKFQITESGSYLLSTQGNPSHVNLCKYTDNTYSTTDAIIYNTKSTNVLVGLELQAGYYALCYNKSSGDYNNFIVKNWGQITDLIAGQKVNINAEGNLFDAHAAGITVGKYLLSNGSMGDNQAYSISDYIKIKPSQQYHLSADGDTPATRSSAAVMQYYTKGMIYISSLDILVNTTFTTPATAEYLRFSFANDKTDISLREWDYRGDYHTYNPISGYINEKADVRLGVNLFNSNVYANNCYIANTGDIIRNNTLYNVSGFIPVKGGTQYHLSAKDDTAVGSATVQIAYYDENHTYLSCEAVTLKTYTTPASAKYIRFSYNKTSEEVMFEEGSIRNRYYPYSQIGGYIEPVYETLDALMFRNEIKYFPVLYGSYITVDGAISTGISSYRVVKFELAETDEYIVACAGSANSVLVKYTDDTYSTAEKNYGTVRKDFVYIGTLQQGYYALSWNVDYGTLPTLVMKSDEYSLLTKRFTPKDFGCTIQDFSKFVNAGNGWTNNVSHITSNSNTGVANMISYPSETYEDTFILKADVIPLTADQDGDYSCTIGKYASYGTAVKIRKNGTDISAYVIRYESDFSETIVYTLDISSLRFGLEKKLSVTLEKKVDSIVYFTLSVCDETGNELTVDRIDGYKSPMTAECAGLGKGKIVCYTSAGTWDISGMSFNYRKDAADIKLIIAGHSFVEGNNSTVNDKDKRFSYLLAESVGINNCLIFGHGGGGMEMRNSLIEQIQWFPSTRYVLIMLGTNDTDAAYNARYMGSFNDTIASFGMKPIWLTIPPYRDGTVPKPTLEAYIEDNFEYVDIRPIFYNANGTINTDMFIDNIHPSIEGYRRMYVLIKNELAKLYGI